MTDSKFEVPSSSRLLSVSILIFEDERVEQLAPITHCRPAFAITVGSYRLIDLLGELGQPIRFSARGYLDPICQRDFAPSLSLRATSDDRASLSLVVNARCVPTTKLLPLLRSLTSRTQPGVVWAGEDVAAIVAPAHTCQSLLTSGSDHTNVAAEILRYAKSLPKIEETLSLLSFAHDVVAQSMALTTANLEYRIATNQYKQCRDGVFVADESCLHDAIHFDTKAGPVVIEQDVSIGPFVYLRGPVYIGRGAKIAEHASIKDAVCLGHTTKIGGEVEGTIVEPYSNKQHYGFLGHSYLGSWINLGAGTCNSDLKNTYGLVNVEYPVGKVATGMQFMGCVIGDYTKSAINSSIFTGKLIGACSMVYGIVTSNVPSFVNYAKLLGYASVLPPEIMALTQKRMFARRKVEQQACDIDLLHHLFRSTESERDEIKELLRSGS